MARRAIYTRTYSNSSAGQLVSGKGAGGDPLSDEELIHEFQNHVMRCDSKPTALVSVSSRIIDTVKRAFDKHHVNGEPPADVWVAFFEIPETMHETRGGLHSAQRLEKECGGPSPSLFKYEFVFEWAIPEKYVSHKVSLQTLMDRGLRGGRCFFSNGPELQHSSTTELRRQIAEKLKPASPHYGPWEIGVGLASWARGFGARAPLGWIARQFFYDCVWTNIVDDDVVRLDYVHGYSTTVDFDFFCEFDDGIETALVHWWLADIDFVLNYKRFKEWQDAMEDTMAWD